MIRQDFRIQQASGKAKCQHCNELIAKDEWEVVGPVRSKFDRHFHLFSQDGCNGWIYHNFGFIKALLYKLITIGGDDYDEAIDSLITLWEKGHVS